MPKPRRDPDDVAKRYRARRVVSPPGPAEQRRHGWQKGQSGNPGGTPKAVKILRDLIAERTGNGVEIVDLAVAAMRGEVKGISREYAHQWLADRFYGKPKQSVQVEGTITAEHHALFTALQLSPHERRERIAELQARKQLPEPEAVEVAVRAEPNGHAVGD